ncbi:MAG: polyprenyl synthetase family protein [Candidatus Rokubacteria bacterium]|nr:polyprenyl synthetase family protein [Candidatus Rokubacteria bacterium]
MKERVAALLGDELVAVEADIARELDSPVALIQEMGGYIAGAGGKRLRPMLLLLAARLAGYRGPRSVRLACVVEVLHTATLIHDDVVDQAPLRRGRPSANAQWGDDASVLVDPDAHRHVGQLKHRAHGMRRVDERGERRLGGVVPGAGRRVAAGVLRRRDDLEWPVLQLRVHILPAWQIEPAPSP